MPLQKLQFRAGINRDSTSYTNEGGWFDGDKVRFRNGLPEKIGGWTKYSDNQFVGTCRALHTWTALDNTNFIGIGTSQKYYLNAGGTYYDITPIRLTTSAGEVTFSASEGDATITVTDADHGANINDFVTFSGSASLGENITDTVLDQEYQITSITGANTYTIEAKDTSGNEVLAASGDTGTGGSSTVAEYQINVGLDDNSYGTGWGAGVWGGQSINQLEVVMTSASLSFSGTTFNVVSATGLAQDDVILSDRTGEAMKITGINSLELTVARRHGHTPQSLDGYGSAATGSQPASAGSGGSTVSESFRLVLGNAVASDDSFTLLDGTATATDQTITVDNTASFPSAGFLRINLKSSNSEIVQYTGKTSTTFTGLTRGLFGTTAISHADNTTIEEAVGGWGIPATTNIAGALLRHWSHDNFGEDLIMNVRDGGIYYWDRSGGTSARAVDISIDQTTNNFIDFVPRIAKKVIVSERDRHILAFGCDSETASGIQDPLLIRFASQESITDWQSLPTNTAGELRIGTGSEIITAIQTKQQTLVITDVSVHALQFIGPPFTFGITEVGRNTTIISENAAVAIDESVYWMGYREFYVYNGRTQKLPCPVQDFVFNDLNREQDTKIIAGQNSAYSEVWWFYPSSSATANDRYVVYNYEQNIWYYGTLARTAWVDRGVLLYPIAASTDNYLYYQEFGFDDGSQSPASGITSFIESSQVTIGDGDQFFFANRVIPDITFRESTNVAPKVNLILKARRFPGATYSQTETSAVTQSASTPIELFTEKADIRLRGRSFAVRVESTETGVSWRLGTTRVDLRQDGRR